MIADDDGTLWDYLESFCHRAPLPDASHAALAVNPLCGDEIELSLRVSAEGRIAAAAFSSRGCQVSQAAAALLCERIEGFDYRQIEAISQADVLRWCGVQLSPVRQTCALLGLQALRRALKVSDVTHLSNRGH